MKLSYFDKDRRQKLEVNSIQCDKAQDTRAILVNSYIEEDMYLSVIEWINSISMAYKLQEKTLVLAIILAGLATLELDSPAKDDQLIAQICLNIADGLIEAEPKDIRYFSKLGEVKLYHPI